MNSRFHLSHHRPPGLPALAAALILVGLGASHTSANFVVTVVSVPAAAGSTGNTLQVNLTNDGPSAVTVGGFAFEITAGAGVTFTAVDNLTTATYLFAGHSTYGSDISNQPPNLPGSVLDAYDIYSPGGGGTLLGAGSTARFGLGDVHFNVAAGASGPISITLSGPLKTNFSNASGMDITQSTGLTLVNGAVNVPSSVPEPTSLAMTGLALSTSLGFRLLASHRRSRRRLVGEGPSNG